MLESRDADGRGGREVWQERLSYSTIKGSAACPDLIVASKGEASSRVMQGTKDGSYGKRLPTARWMRRDEFSAVTQGYTSHEPPLGRGTATEMQGRR